MAMLDSVTVKNFTFPVFHLQIGLGNDVLSNLLDSIDSGVEKLSIREEVAHNTLVTLNQFTLKFGKTAKYGMSMMVLCCNTKVYS